MLNRYRLLAACMAGATVACAATIEQVVARVNGGVITLGDMKQAGADPAAFLRDQIDRLLLTQRARDLGINVTDALARKIADLQVKSGLVEEDRFQAWVCRSGRLAL